jgi:hypothetical protein
VSNTTPTETLTESLLACVHEAEFATSGDLAPPFHDHVNYNPTE